MSCGSWIIAAQLSAILAAAPDFDTQILPVLTKSGCNAGACHGAAAGRGGLHLSLFGGEPAADHQALVHDLEGRRINLVHPERSLLLAKPTGQLPHGGDLALAEDGPGAKLILEWIRWGAWRVAGRRLVEFDVQPRAFVGDAPGASAPLSARARFDDGSSEDVTSWTVFTPADPSCVAIDERANATLLRRGRHVFVARYLDRVVPLHWTVPIGESPVDLAHLPRANPIDEEVLRELERLRLAPAPPADAATFLRRCRLDLTGRLPSPEEVEEFSGEASRDSRERLIDRLLASEDFVDYWTWRLAGLLRIRSPNDPPALLAYHAWLRRAVQLGTPLDHLTRELLTATGDSHEVGPANFARMSADARGQAELTAQVFLGVRLGCANCHNHPLDRWTRDDYHGLAAVFARLVRGRVVQIAGRGAVTNPRTGEAALPRIPGEGDIPPGAESREAFADWLTSPGNPYFATALVNRLWQAMLGRGLVEPVDDLRQTNPATHEYLLHWLSRDFVAHGYDLRHTLRLIAVSETYARGAKPSGAAVDEQFYSYAATKALPAEVLADAIADVAGVADVYVDLPANTRAIQLVDPATESRALDVLGRCSRTGSCEGNLLRGGLSARLHQLNGALINGKITARTGRLHKLLDSGVPTDAIAAEFYLRALGRAVTADERKRWQAGLSTGDETQRAQRLEDFVWSLLASKEFATNH